MRTITELLERLAGLRPEVCDFVLRHKMFYLNGCAITEVERGDGNDGVRLHIIQGEVQQAIEAEAWKWGLPNGGLPGTDARYVARILTGSPFDADSHWYGTSDDSPAHALLSAYVAALEAVAEVV